MDQKIDEKSGSDTEIITKTLEQDFEKILEDITSDGSLTKFKKEFEKLHLCLKKSHESEKRLMSKCRDLNAEMVANTAKIATALKLKSEDEGTIGKLKEELDSAWKMVETAMGKETQARETIGSLKGEIEELTRLVESGAGIGIIGEDVEKLEKERDSLREQVEMAIDDVKEVRGQNESFEKKVVELTKQLEYGEIVISEQKLEVTLQVGMEMGLNHVTRHIERQGDASLRASR